MSLNGFTYVNYVIVTFHPMKGFCKKKVSFDDFFENKSIEIYFAYVSFLQPRTASKGNGPILGLFDTNRT